jgi:drug/metabolite transporter (DMT)-like permease
VLASVLIHIAYYFTLAEAYRYGDLTHVYPIARGTAPLITALIAMVCLGETLGLFGWAGVLILALGILLLALKGSRLIKQFDRRSMGFALLTALTITAYTLVDGIGGRLAGSALSYTAWLFLLSGSSMAVYGALRIGPRLVRDFKSNWGIAVAGAALSTAAYGTAIWAMSVAPIALVAALRETSVLFAALFGSVLLREPLLPVRIVAAALVLTGAMLVRFR